MVRRERATRCLLIRSAVPNVFCAGADLKVAALLPCSSSVSICACYRHCLPIKKSTWAPYHARIVQERAAMTQQETSEFVTELRQAFSAVQVRSHPPAR